MKTQLPSLEQLIRQKIKSRIFAAMAILVLGTAFITVIEAAMSYSKLVVSLEARASQLEDKLISEVLVNNLAATGHIIDDANRIFSDQHVQWIGAEKNPSLIPTLGLTWAFPGNWKLVRPLKRLGNQDFGLFIFSGNFFTSGNLVTTLVQRLTSAVLICILIGVLLLPIARRTPRDLILEPVKHLLGLLNYESEEIEPKSYPRYTEIKSIEDDFKALMAEKQRLEEERIEAEQMVTVTKTAQLLAHDIKRPFATLTSVLDSLPKADSMEDVQTLLADTLPGVKRSFARVENILQELLSVNNPNLIIDGKVDVLCFIQNGVDCAIGKREDVRSRITISVQEGLSVDGSPVQLERVVTNLVANALQAMGQDDRIWIDAKDIGHSSLQLTVTNSGTFIEEADRLRIFRCFYTKGDHKGSGIGLAICKKIVKDHCGTITASSTKSQTDSTTAFKVKLPLWNNAITKSCDAKRFIHEINS